MRVIACAALSVLVAGCDDAPPAPGSGRQATGSATSGAASGPKPEARSPEPSPSASGEPKPPPYSGPTGALTGTVRIKGDPPPETPHKYPKECEGEAGAVYGKLFRVGKDHQLADALVAVSKYQGYVPPKEAAIRVTIKNCAYSTRTIAMTDGQHLEVRNLEDDTKTYIPWLDGSRAPAAIVAVPHGDVVKLHSRGFQRYWLRDQMGMKFMVAHVFHLHFATTAVTGLDGKYRIEGIPVGKVELSAMLPQANLLADPPGSALGEAGRSVDIKEGDNHADFELTFDKKRDTPAVPEETLPDEKRRLAESAAAADSAAPSAKPSATPKK